MPAFAGLEASKALAKAAVDVTLVDAYNHHCFQPLLYQVATAALSPADVAWPIRAILRAQQNVRVIMARVTAIDVQTRRVHTTEIDLPYDYLVLATGSTHSYFGHDDWAPFAPGLKHIADATEIRRRFLLAFERAEVVEDDAARARLLTFVIVGGGATGVEMAGAIAEVAQRTLQHDFRRIDPRKSRIILIEAGPRLLPTFPQALSDYARRSLQSMGVEVELNRKVTGCDAEGVTLDDGRIEAATVIWAAGVVASPAATWIGAEHDRAGRITGQSRPDAFRDIPTFLLLATPRVWSIDNRPNRSRHRARGQTDGPLCRPSHRARECRAVRRRRHSPTTIWANLLRSAASPPWLSSAFCSSPDFSVGCSGARSTSIF